jgi:hypothetical protein
MTLYLDSPLGKDLSEQHLGKKSGNRSPTANTTIRTQPHSVGHNPIFGPAPLLSREGKGNIKELNFATGEIANATAKKDQRRCAADGT